MDELLDLYQMCFPDCEKCRNKTKVVRGTYDCDTLPYGYFDNTFICKNNRCMAGKRKGVLMLLKLFGVESQLNGGINGQAE